MIITIVSKILKLIGVVSKILMVVNIWQNVNVIDKVLGYDFVIKFCRVLF